MDTDVGRVAAESRTIEALSSPGVTVSRVPAKFIVKHYKIPGGYRTVQQTDNTARHGTDSIRFRRDLSIIRRGLLKGWRTVAPTGRVR